MTIPDPTKPRTEFWSARQIQDHFKTSPIPVVVFRNQDYRPLNFGAAARMEGDYRVSITPYEVIVFWDSQRKEKE